MKRQPAILWVLVGLAASGATCKGREQNDGKSKVSKAPQEAVALKPVAPPVTEMEGVELDTIAPEQRARTLGLLNETYCYCGCARTVASCLANRASCSCVQCSERMANFILTELREGATFEEVETQLLEGFSEGFNGKAHGFEETNRPIKGSPEAKYTIAEFADFRCPHCSVTHEVLAELLQKRQDVRLVYHYFPLSGGGETAVLAAESAEEARQQGKFWEMADVLFKNQHALDDEDLIAYGAQVGLDVEKLKKALKERTHRDRVMADKRLGESVGVDHTPYLFIDGRPFGLSRTLRNLELRLTMEEARARCD